MKKLNLLIYIFSILFLSACGDTKKEESQRAASQKSKMEKNKKETSNSNSRIIVTLNGKDYHSPVNCTYFEHDYFYFKSDKSEMKDTNGDGLIITGFQKGNKITFTLKVEDKEYSSNNIPIQKKGNTAIGAGKLFLDGGSESFKMTCKVICD